MGEGKMAIYLIESPSKKANRLHFKRQPKQYYILSKIDLFHFSELKNSSGNTSKAQETTV